MNNSQHLAFQHLLVAVLLLCIPLSFASQLAAPADGQTHKQYDYYSPDASDQHQIRVVEKHHWSKAILAIENAKHKRAKVELDFILRWCPNHLKALQEFSKLAVRIGQPQSASTYLEAAVKFRPQYESSHLLYGIHLYRIKRFREANDKFAEALSINPQSSEAHYNLGLTHFELGNYKQSLAHARQAYNFGYPLPGLKVKLKKHGLWDTEVERQ